MPTQSGARAKQVSLALLFLMTVWFTFGEQLPGLGAALFQSPPPSRPVGRPPMWRNGSIRQRRKRLSSGGMGCTAAIHRRCRISSNAPSGATRPRMPSPPVSISSRRRTCPWCRVTAQQPPPVNRPARAAQPGAPAAQRSCSQTMSRTLCNAQQNSLQSAHYLFWLAARCCSCSSWRPA